MKKNPPPTKDKKKNRGSDYDELYEQSKRIVKCYEAAIEVLRSPNAGEMNTGYYKLEGTKPSDPELPVVAHTKQLTKQVRTVLKENEEANGAICELEMKLEAQSE